MLAICDVFVCDVRKPHDEKFGMSEFFGESHDVYIVDMREPRPQLREGSPRTAGADAQCLPTAFTALRSVGVTTAKMNSIKKINKENERKWSNTMETTLVEMWQQRPCIFDVSSKDFHDRVKRDKAWREIADTLDLPGKFGAISC